MNIGVSLLIITLSSYFIYLAGKYFTEASSNLGDYARLPRSVKGATFDAISSSLPELLTALYAVLFFHKFEVGLGTIVGSALFNILVIPGIAVLVAPIVFKIGKKVIFRDALFYIGTVIALIIAILSSSVWGIIIPVIFLLGYGLYIFILTKDTKQHKHSHQAELLKKKAKKRMKLGRTIITVIITMIIIAIATFFLTQSAIGLADALNIPAFIVAFIVIASATSIPDAVISIINARKGDIDDSTSNVFGSNIFDILVGLALPLLIAYFIIGPTTIVFSQLEFLAFLLGATLLSFFFMLRNKRLTKLQAILLLITYGIIITYALYISFI